MLQATVKSSLVECKYHFLVGTEFDSMLCCSGKPTIDIPIIMYIPDIRPNVQLYQPNNWNPQTMPICEISLPTYNDIMSNQNIKVEFSSTGMINQNNMNQGEMTAQTQPINKNSEGMTVQTNPININQGGMTAQTQTINMNQGGMSSQTLPFNMNQGGMTSQTQPKNMNQDEGINQGGMTMQTQPLNNNQGSDQKNNS